MEKNTKLDMQFIKVSLPSPPGTLLLTGRTTSPRHLALTRPRLNAFPAEPQPPLSAGRLDSGSSLPVPPPQDSRQHYEMEYRHRAANLEKCMSELWRMERNRDKNAREMKVRPGPSLGSPWHPLCPLPGPSPTAESTAGGVGISSGPGAAGGQPCGCRRRSGSPSAPLLPWGLLAFPRLPRSLLGPQHPPPSYFTRKTETAFVLWP